MAYISKRRSYSKESCKYILKIQKIENVEGGNKIWWKKALTCQKFLPIIISHEKNVDEDSRLYSNGTASRGRCEPGASRVYLNITSELQLLNGLLC